MLNKTNSALIIGILAGYVLLLGVAAGMGKLSNELLLIMGILFFTSMLPLLLTDRKKAVCNRSNVNK